MKYRANILPGPDGHGITVDAHSYTGSIQNKGELITISTVPAKAPIEEFIGMVYLILQNIGCEDPRTAEIEDLR